MSRRQKLTAVMSAVCVALAAWVAALSIGAYVDDRNVTDQLLRGVSQQVLDQSRLNQRHIDCLAAFLIRRDPDGCQDVRDQLIRDGILPTNAGSNPTGPTG